MRGRGPMSVMQTRSCRFDVYCQDWGRGRREPGRWRWSSTVPTGSKAQTIRALGRAKLRPGRFAKSRHDERALQQPSMARSGTTGRKNDELVHYALQLRGGYSKHFAGVHSVLTSLMQVSDAAERKQARNSPAS